MRHPRSLILALMKSMVRRILVDLLIEGAITPGARENRERGGTAAKLLRCVKILKCISLSRQYQHSHVLLSSAECGHKSTRREHSNVPTFAVR